MSIGKHTSNAFGMLVLSTESVHYSMYHESHRTVEVASHSSQLRIVLTSTDFIIKHWECELRLLPDASEHGCLLVP